MSLLPETKKCRKCGKIKNKNEYIIQAISSDGLFAQCKQCYKLSRNLFRREQQLRYKFGMDEMTYNLMLKSQNGVCAICNQPEIKKQDNKINHLSVDHHHPTSKIRGLLCHRCNIMIAYIENNFELLEATLKYLEETK